MATNESTLTADEPRLSATHEGYSIAAQLGRSADGAGTPIYTCRLTATELGDRPGPLLFERTLLLSQEDASRSNAWRPGTLPPLNQIEANLVGDGMRYIE